MSLEGQCGKDLVSAVWLYSGDWIERVLTSSMDGSIDGFMAKRAMRKWYLGGGHRAR